MTMKAMKRDYVGRDTCGLCRQYYGFRANGAATGWRRSGVTAQDSA